MRQLGLEGPDAMLDELLATGDGDDDAAASMLPSHAEQGTSPARAPNLSRVPTWPRLMSSRLMPRSSAPMLSPASPRSSVFLNISTPVHVVLTSLSSPTT